MLGWLPGLPETGAATNAITGSRVVRANAIPTVTPVRPSPAHTFSPTNAWHARAQGLARIYTAIAGCRVQSADRYTTRPIHHWRAHLVVAFFMSTGAICATPRFSMWLVVSKQAPH